MPPTILQPQVIDAERLRRIAAGLTDSNLRYFLNCVGFWLTVKPDCGAMAWLEYSVYRSRNRVGTSGLRAALAGLSDDELIWLYENSAVAECTFPSSFPALRPERRKRYTESAMECM